MAENHLQISRKEGAEMLYSQDPHPWVGNPQMGWQSQWQRFSPRSQGSEPSSGSPALVLHQKDGPPEHLVLKVSRACVQESWRAVGNRVCSERAHETSHMFKCLVQTTMSYGVAQWTIFNILWQTIMEKNICMYNNHFAVHQKLTQHCKSTILQ